MRPAARQGCWTQPFPVPAKGILKNGGGKRFCHGERAVAINFVYNRSKPGGEVPLSLIATNRCGRTLTRLGRAPDPSSCSTSPVVMSQPGHGRADAELASRGYDVSTSPTPTRPRSVRRHLPDLILRRGDARALRYELCRQLKEDPVLPHSVPFFWITGLSDREDKVKGMRSAPTTLNTDFFRGARVNRCLLKEFTDELKPPSRFCARSRSVARDPPRKATANASPSCRVTDAISVSTKNP
jgi:hypothetical protein